MFFPDSLFDFETICDKYNKLVPQIQWTCTKYEKGCNCVLIQATLGDLHVSRTLPMQEILQSKIRIVFLQACIMQDDLVLEAVKLDIIP